MNIFQSIKITNIIINDMRSGKIKASADQITPWNSILTSLKTLQALLTTIESTENNTEEVSQEITACMNGLKNEINELQKKPSVGARVFSFFLPFLEKINAQNIFKNQLSTFITQYHLKALTESLSSINNTLEKRQSYKPLKDEIEFYDQYAPNTLFKMNQGRLPSLGGSRGECYGFVFEYAAKRHLNREQPLIFSEKITDLQNNQALKNPTGQMFYPKRLTTQVYQPDLNTQAEELAKYAQNNKGTGLFIGLRGEKAGHATYLEYTKDNKFNYFDSNVGAFEFNNLKDFSNFYKELYSNKLYRNINFHSYTVNQLLTTPPTKTWAGKMRSMLTGPSYIEGMKAESRVTQLLIGVSSAALALISTAAILATAPISIPLLGAIALGVGIGSLAYVAGRALSTHIMEQGFHGLLAIPNYIQHIDTLSKSSREAFLNSHRQPSIEPSPKPTQNEKNTLEQTTQASSNFATAFKAYSYGDKPMQDSPHVEPEAQAKTRKRGIH